MLAYRLGYIYATFITLNVRLELEIQNMRFIHEILY